MRQLTVICIWAAVFIGDGIILPALTGWPSGLGIMVLLAALAITFGIHRWVIGLGIVLAGMTELMVGAYFGAIIGAWLVMVWGWHFLNRFLNMKPVSENDSLVALVPFTLLGLIIFGLGEGALWVISRLAYEPRLTVTTFVNILGSPTIFTVVTIELAVIIFILHLIYSPRNSIYG